MMKNVLSIFMALLVSATAFGQNTNVPAFSNKQAIPYSNNIGKMPLAFDQSQANGFSDNVGEKCLQHSVTEERMERNSLYRAGIEEAQRITRQIMREEESGERATAPVYTIPVVFHVIHKGESVGTGTNLSTAQIESAIDGLNRDYRATADDGGIGQGAGPDTEIQFCLAGVDPQGAPHSGINRVNGTSVSGYSTNGITQSNDATVKALSNWDNRYYMNVWIVSEIEGNGADLSNPNNWGGGTLAYAYLPQSPITFMSDIDGVVIVNICIGNDPNGTLGYRLWPASVANRPMTHEVGHYLGISHTFNDSNPNSCSDGDGFADTPNARQLAPAFNCNYSNTCTNQMTENYMDYTSEFCQNRFTNDQKSYMRGILTGVRSDLINTNNCGATTDYDAAISAISAPSGSLCQTTFSPVVTLNNYASTTLTSVQIQYYVDSQTPSTYNWSGSLGSNSSTAVTLNSMTTTAGAHTFTARTASGTLNGSNTDQVTSNDETTSNFSVASGGSAITLTLDFDCYASETSWEIQNASNQVVASGSGYTNSTSAEQIVESLCLAQGCYDFIISDTQGDGLSGTPFGCAFDGDYAITDGSSTLVQMTATGGDFGSSATHNFCIGGGGTPLTCENLVEYYGDGFLVNATDLPNFDIQAIDNDQEAVSTTLAGYGYDSEWMTFAAEVAPGDTNQFLGVTSWFADNTQAADNWLTFGPATMLSDDGQISWKHMMSNNNYRDGYEVLVNTNGTAIADFNGATVLYSVSDNDPSTDGDTTWTQQSAALPAGTYASLPLYFAFHHNALDMEVLFLDDIIVEGCNSLIVSVSEREEFNLSVYPNPSVANFTFKFAMEAAENIDFRMLNSIGQEVWNYSSFGKSNGTQVIETQDLSAGVYTLVVKGERLNVSERLILTK